MKSSPQTFKAITIFKTTLVGCAALVLLGGVLHAQTTILKNNIGTNTDLLAVQLDQTNAWVGGVVPGTNDLAAFGTNNSASSGALNIGGGVQFLGIIATGTPNTGNISITNSSTNTNAVMVLGASGVDWSAVQNVSGTNRELRLNPLLVLTNDQTWITGLGTANSTMITASNVITGPGRLTVAGTNGATNAAIYLQNSNSTFSGGVTVNAGGALRLSTSASTAGGLVTASPIGTGPLTINGGTIFGGGASIASTNIAVNGDFAVNSGGTNVSINGRLSIGGTIDLGGTNRTVTLGNYRPLISTNATNAITGGIESFRFLIITNTNGGGPLVRVTNGTIRFVRDSSGTASDFVAVNFSQSNSFTGGSGFAIGSNVITTLATGNPFGSTATNQPMVTVEVGGYFNLADAANLRSPTIRTLSGAGVVTALATNTNGVVTLTINPQAGDSATFSGQIANGASFTNMMGTTNLQSRVAITKSGAGTQVLDGTNTHTGNTAVSAGLLELGTNGVLTFAISSSGSNNAVTGAGSVLFRGKFSFDLGAASTNNGDSWTIVSTTTKSYDGNFAVSGFTNSGGRWTRGANGVYYQFAQSNSILSVTTNPPAPVNAYSSWLANYPSLTGTNTNTAADPEGDGFVNLVEFAFGGNPTAGTPALLASAKSGTNSVFTFIADTNALDYTVQTTGTLAAGPWTNTVVTLSAASDQSGVLLTNYTRLQFIVPAAGSVFYRALGVPKP